MPWVEKARIVCSMTESTKSGSMGMLVLTAMHSHPNSLISAAVCLAALVFDRYVIVIWPQRTQSNTQLWK